MATASDRFARRAAADCSSAHAPLTELAARLAEIAGELHRAAADPAAVEAAAVEAHARQRPSLLALARHAYALRRQRAAIFGSADLFGEPAWDILLDLFIAQAEGKPVSVSSACIGSASPATTGLRWLAVLAEKGLVMREPDAQDHRRIMVRLTDAGVAAMERFLLLAAQRPAPLQPKQPAPA